jgi:hypothetical protein
LDTAILFAMLAANLPNFAVAALCVVCSVLLLRSSDIPADAARIGAAGFVCLFLETIVGTGVQIALSLPRVRDAWSMPQLGLVLAAIGYLRMVLNAAGIILLARAIFIGRRRAAHASA